MRNSTGWLLALSALALSAAACGGTSSNPDVIEPFDSGGPRDIVQVPTDNGVPPADTNTMCDFTPFPVATMCRVLGATCMTGAVNCDGGTQFPNSTCHCESIRMGNQVWHCDNVCP